MLTNWSSRSNLAAKSRMKAELLIQGLYRGHGTNVLRIVPEVLMKFAIHDQLRVICGATAVDTSQVSVSTRVAAGSVTGLLRTALLHPLSVIRTRLAADIGPVDSGDLTTVKSRLYRGGIMQCALDTWKRERIRGFYGGAGLAAVTTVPYLAVCFSAYDILSRQLPSDKRSTHAWWFPALKIGTAAGTSFTQH
jgi:hypothetical protein